MAILLVVLFHANLRVPGGFVGVDVFFVISGFVIANMLVRELSDTDAVSFATFYSRRVRRILPALALLVVVVAIGSAFLLSPLGPQQDTAHTGAAASVFLANYQLYGSPVGYFGVSTAFNAFLHTWSLSVEEQFYLVFPAILLAAWSFGKRDGVSRRNRTTVVVVVVSLVSFAFSWALTNGNTFGGLIRSPQQLAFYGSPARVWEFGAGALLALVAPQLAKLTHASALALGGAGAFFIAVAAFKFDAFTPFPGTAALIPVVGTALIIASGTATKRGVTSLLGLAPLVWIGDLSYSWYLWHWPLIVFAHAIWRTNGWIVTVAAFGSLVPAALSYYLVENRIRHNTGLVGRRVLPVAAVCVLVPLTACLLIVPVSKAHQSAATRELVDAQQLHADHVRGCDSPTPIAQRTTNCTWTVPHPRGTIYLVGDSNAGHFTEPVARAANQLGYNLTVATMSSCPFLTGVAVDTIGVENHPCTKFVAASIAQLQKIRPSLVIVAISGPGTVDNVTVGFRDLLTGQMAYTQQEKAHALTKGLTATLSTLGRAGVPTLLIQTIPQFDWDPVACGLDVYSSPESCATTMTRAVANERRQLTYDAQAAAVAAVPSAQVVDFANDLCPHDTCSTLRDGLWMYRDGGHLTIAGSLTLTDQARAAISRAAH